ncbi:GFA family protein [Marinobacterium mangrovicola]|uniref:CENP-V/GFA domain-containing protein n=1 Tax=Marinobacterium mangrovicola TaxID=1476959 RepID=A0A4R1GME0_9GAMM|nr:GFA family protein [Marinobacterium mangrovicola]TCK08230.1 hypothetical protein CLV83_0304 [Marinobacterium mangrovicola]
MPSLSPLTVRCLCGAVTLTVMPKSHDVGACHCNTCRKWGGGPLMAVECAGEVTFSGEEALGVFDSSDWAERGFCKECGTHLFYRLKAGGYYAVPVGLFDNADQWTLAEQVFIDEKPPFYSFSQKTRAMTGAELFAKYDQP